MRRWHHQLTHLHIHIDWSRNVSWKIVKLQNVITSLFFNQFSSGFQYFVQKFLTLSSEIKLNLVWMSSLSWPTFSPHSLCTSFVICRGLIFSLKPPRVLCWNLFYFLYMMHHVVPQGTALCSAILRPPDVKSCRIIWCVVQREHIVENRCDLLGFKCFQRLSMP